MARERTDILLVERGLAPSREQAKRLILAGEVLVNQAPAGKPGTLISTDSIITVKAAPRYVGRGGLKMEGALAHFGIDVTGFTALDIGASTGGFTDCLLQHGATKVFAFDVGTNQLAWKIRSDARVVSREKINMRHFEPSDIGNEPLDLIVADVSFISLTLVLLPAIAALRPGGQAVVLIKPQFELRREDIGPGGIVRDPALHQQACDKIEGFIRSSANLEWLGLMPSPIQGADGNCEFLAWFRLIA
jgi:23S rRNA (cytidine1920-2'-O)/16S rRNA (cytidine1409-2'-O)-methyltransferase